MGDEAGVGLTGLRTARQERSAGRLVEDRLLCLCCRARRFRAGEVETLRKEEEEVVVVVAWRS